MKYAIASGSVQDETNKTLVYLLNCDRKISVDILSRGPGIT